jgi:hypothetical protein
MITIRYLLINKDNKKLFFLKFKFYKLEFYYNMIDKHVNKVLLIKIIHSHQILEKKIWLSKTRKKVF